MNKKIFIVSFVFLLIILGGSYFFFNKYYIYENGKISKISDLREYADFVGAQNQGKMDDAIKIAQDILDKTPGDIQAMLMLAEAYVNKGSHDHEEVEYAPKALELVNQILEKDPNNAEAYRIQGYAFEIQEKFDEAVQAYDKSLELKPDDNIYNSRGHAYELMGKFQLAENDYLKGSEINSENPNIQMNLARIYLSKGDETKAKEFAEKVINNKSGNILAYTKATAYSVLGQIASNNKNKNEAVINFSEAVKVLPTFKSGYVGRAQTIIVLSDSFTEEEKKQVFNDLNMAVQLDPNSSWSYFLFGLFYEKQSNYLNSLENYKKALEVVGADLTIIPIAREPISKKYQGKIDSINNKLK